MNAKSRNNNKCHVVNDEGEACFRSVSLIQGNPTDGNIKKSIMLGTTKVTSSFYKCKGGMNKNKEKIADPGDKIIFIYTQDTKHIWFRVESTIKPRDNILWRRERSEVMDHCKGSNIDQEVKIFTIVSNGCSGSKSARSECFLISFGRRKEMKESEDSYGVWISSKYYNEKMVPCITQSEKCEKEHLSQVQSQQHIPNCVCPFKPRLQPQPDKCHPIPSPLEL